MAGSSPAILQAVQPQGGAHPSGPGAAEAQRAAEEFEGVFISQILGQINVGFTTPGVGKGGDDGPFASMLRDEYAKIIGRSGGIGVADAVMREILRAQEVG